MPASPQPPAPSPTLAAPAVVTACGPPGTDLCLSLRRVPARPTAGDRLLLLLLRDSAHVKLRAHAATALAAIRDREASLSSSSHRLDVYCCFPHRRPCAHRCPPCVRGDSAQDLGGAFRDCFAVVAEGIDAARDDRRAQHARSLARCLLRTRPRRRAPPPAADGLTGTRVSPSATFRRAGSAGETAADFRSRPALRAALSVALLRLLSFGAAGEGPGPAVSAALACCSLRAMS